MENPRPSLKQPTAPERSFGFQHIRIPIFVKLASLTALLIILIISVVSFSMLQKQKEQYTERLSEFGKTMIRVVASNTPEKLLSGEELALLELVNDISKNDQVLYTLITDENGIIEAHSQIEQVNKKYLADESQSLLEKEDDIKVSTFTYGGEKAFLFTKPIIYQKLTVGEVVIAISQREILKSIHNAEVFLFWLTVIITVIGICLSFGLSLYFSKPLIALREGTKKLASGDFKHRVKVRRKDEIGELGNAFNQMAEGLAEREKIRETFGKYVTPEVRDEILSGNIPLDGELRTGTVLFADLRGFTPYVEAHSPEDVIHGMRAYFNAMQDAIRLHHGLVLQYVGDEMMVVFGVPLQDEHHATKAVSAALEMRKQLDVLNQKRISRGQKPFRHGVGIHTGEFLAGNIGSDDQLSYGLIGNVVNVASRIEGLTKEHNCDILISEETVNKLEKKPKMEKKSPVKVKGYSKTVVVYRIIE
ncbi:MAG: adenylate/guanylate cyclase domain-containing protein [Deltaproteobacteria bacterium]|nr:adenylate/guanylate cyclase domain-containing protein [Deltaproteobacteria bacterium]